MCVRCVYAHTFLYGVCMHGTHVLVDHVRSVCINMCACVCYMHIWYTCVCVGLVCEKCVHVCCMYMAQMCALFMYVRGVLVCACVYVVYI